MEKSRNEEILPQRTSEKEKLSDIEMLKVQVCSLSHFSCSFCFGFYLILFSVLFY